MKKHKKQPPPDNSGPKPIVIGIVALGCVIIVLCFARLPASHKKSTAQDPSGSAVFVTQPVAGQPRIANSTRTRAQFFAGPTRPPEQIVAEKISQFAQKRLEFITAIAKSRNLALPPEIGRFFAAVGAGNWADTTNMFAALDQQWHGTNRQAGYEAIWSAIRETHGVAEQVHEWPAQRLLDYGNAILASLRPGMVYVGGTDPGRFIPTLLNETSGDPHVILTQNALADSSYLDYLRSLYGDRFNTLTAEDSQNNFTSYLQDAQKRLQHDQQYPDEPRQINPGEDVRMTDNRVQVSGQTAVMQINELLLKNLMQKNPNSSFALEESLPMKSLYATATTLGPVTEISAEPSNALTSERAGQSLDYWRSTTQSLLSDPDSANSSAVRDTYSKMIVSQANLFVNHKLTGAAEQAYQFAASLSPSQPEVVFGYTNLLLNQKRYGEATQVVQSALNAAPDNAQFQSLLAQLGKLK